MQADAAQTLSYRGRFAPSPTGPLHQGSLLAAVASYLDAKAHKGKWLVRIEDIDPLREIPHAASAILKSLDAHGLHWDESVVYQSQRQVLYQDVLATLAACGSTYTCACSRSELEVSAGRHQRTCGIHGASQQSPPFAVRFRVPHQTGKFEDCIQGAVPYTLHSGTDDFVLQRKEGFYAYQLAVTADDREQGITHVIRGLDLLHSTPLQRLIFQSLHHNPPEYGHFLLLTDAKGRKLSKQTHARPVDDQQPMKTLYHVLLALGIQRQEIDQASTIQELLEAGIQGWNRENIAAKTNLVEADYWHAEGKA
ncbi:MAG: tRNA glutamyl-Q(34) synthetase GluQRS [Hahellaceae bacterium]|nr:tRNA glutamyl-Q(34) synthetase GluQRS [Hahellaceae bacterium]